MKAYSVDLRQRVLAAREDGMGTAEAAETFAVSEAWVRRVKHRFREKGQVAPAPRPGTARSRPWPVITTASGPEAGTTRAGPRPSTGTGSARRTKMSLRAAEPDRPDGARKRAEWRSGVIPGLAPERLVSLDETAAKTNMTRTHGYAPWGSGWSRPSRTGTRPRSSRPCGRPGSWPRWWPTGRSTGTCSGRTGRRSWSRPQRPGDTVLRGNLGSHRVAGVREAIEGAGCRLLFLPPYRPDRNPIENAFSKLKALLRKAAERTVEGLWKAIGRPLDEFPPEECRNYLRHCGYTATHS